MNLANEFVSGCFLTKDEHKILTQNDFYNANIIYTCEISHDRRNQTRKHKLPSSTP